MLVPDMIVMTTGIAGGLRIALKGQECLHAAKAAMVRRVTLPPAP